MKGIFRSYFINLVTLWVVSEVFPGLSLTGGLKTLAIAAAALMLINFAVLPLLKIMFLPLNILTLGLFTWVVNVVGLYILTTLIANIKLMPYTFSGFSYNGFTIPAYELNILHVAIIASFLVGFITHLLHWFVEK